MIVHTYEVRNTETCQDPYRVHNAGHRMSFIGMKLATCSSSFHNHVLTLNGRWKDVPDQA